MAMEVFTNQLASMMWTVLIVIAIGAVVAGLAALGFWAWMITKYKYKASYRKVFGDVNGQITLGPRKTKRVGPVKNNSQWQAFMSKRTFPPFPQETIMRGNQIDCYLLPDGTFVPATHHIKNDLVKIQAYMNAIVPEGKSWAINEVRELAKTYDPRSKSDQWKTIGLVVVACLIACGAFVAGVYGGYKAFQLGTDKGAEAASRTTDLIVRYANDTGQAQQISGVPAPKPSLPFAIGNIGQPGGTPQ
jgi:hypothetical protein